MLRFERFIAGRYLRGAEGAREGRRFLHFIILVAVGGVAVGVAALLLSLSIVRGFSGEIKEKITGFGAHVQVESIQDEPLSDAESMAFRLARFPQVIRVAPVIQEFVLLRRTSDAIEGVMLWGVDSLPPYLRRQMIQGGPVFSSDTTEATGIVIGAKLARLIGADVGDRIAGFSLRGLDADAGLSGARRPRVKPFVVTGIYETFLENFDEIYVFTNLEAARGFLGYAPDEVTRFDLTLSDTRLAETVSDSVEVTFGFPVMSRTIFEVWRGLFAWVNLQENIIPLVIGVIVIVAAFNIIGALLMIVLEKTGEIGVLQSMGASRRVLRRLFLWLGLLIGLVGTIIGEALALVLALLQERFGIIPLPAEAYYMDTAPIDLNPLDFLIVLVVTLALCLLAAYIPARVASRIDPIRVIRFS